MVSPMNLLSCEADSAPTLVPMISPPRKIISVGMPRTPYQVGVT